MSKKSIGLVEATLAISITHNPDAPPVTVDSVVAALDKLRTLRRQGDVRLVELPDAAGRIEVDVEYGPVIGAWRSDVARTAERVFGPTAKLTRCRRRVITGADLEALQAQAEVTPSAAARDYLLRLIERIANRDGGAQ